MFPHIIRIDYMCFRDRVYKLLPSSAYEVEKLTSTKKQRLKYIGIRKKQ